MDTNPQRQAVIDWAVNGTGSLNIDAKAGTGKTTTLLELCRHIQGYVAILAYNKAIAMEIQGKLDKQGLKFPRYQASTVHGMGYSLCRQVWPKVKIDEFKVKGIVETVIPFEADRTIYATFVEKAVGFAKQRAFGFLESVTNRAAWYDIIDHFGVDELLPETVEQDVADRYIEHGIELSIQVYQRSMAMDPEVLDYDDMILAPLTHNIRVRYPKDWVMVDEAQDTNPARRALAIKLMRKGTGRLIAVGDPNQAIYGFTGADSDAMDLIKAELGSKELPLNKTYRCPKAIVRAAQQYVPTIEAHDTNEEGIVRSINYRGQNGEPDFWNKEAQGLTPNDALLCRNTAPLIDTAYALIREGIACRVEGRDIGLGLIKLARRWKLKTVNALEGRLTTYLEREVQKWQAKGKEERAAQVEDQVATLRVMIDRTRQIGGSTIDDLAKEIGRLFGDTKPGEKPNVVTLSTVHKSKGREWDRVYILGPNLYMPNRWARKEWQLRQENNLIYVAITRAKHELINVIMER